MLCFSRSRSDSGTGLALCLILAVVLHLGLLWPLAEETPPRIQASSTTLHLQLSSRAPGPPPPVTQKTMTAVTPAPATAAPTPAPTKPQRPTLTKALQPLPTPPLPATQPPRSTPREPPPAPKASRPEPQTPDVAQDQASSPEHDAYLALLRQRLQKALRYPRNAQRRRQEGTVEVRFGITAAGQLHEQQVELLASSGIQALDRAALASVRRAAPFPAPPSTLIALKPRVEVSLPVEFQLN